MLAIRPPPACRNLRRIAIIVKAIRFDHVIPQHDIRPASAISPSRSSGSQSSSIGTAHLRAFFLYSCCEIGKPVMPYPFGCDPMDLNVSDLVQVSAPHRSLKLPAIRVQSS